MFRVVLALGLTVAVWIGLHATWTVITGLNAQPRSSDVAVVLGTRVLPSGVPSYWLRGRLERALQLYRDGLTRNVIVSGGFGREGHEEADVMRDYLVERGIPPANVFVDRNGYDTFETAKSVKQLMAANQFESVIVVSHYYHIARILFTFQQFGIPNVSASGVSTGPIWTDGWNLLREFAAFYFYLVRDYAANQEN